MKQLSTQAFAAYLDEAREKIRAWMPLSVDKPINFGHQFVVQLASCKATVNIYNGKKGLNPVYSGDSALVAKLQEALGGGATADSATQQVADTAIDGLYAGSDESGKGDFFGSLVVAATVVDGTTAAKLQAAGVKDCKLLTDKKILELEGIIKETVVDFSVLELKPPIYNMRYEQVLAQGGKLNQLLGFGHVAALSQVLSRQQDCHQALIDQFTTSTVNLRELERRFPDCRVRQMPKAESNLAVAAASVLARAQFLRTMDELAVQAGEEELPKGGGSAAPECARRLARKLGKEALRSFVKLHFANYQRL